MPCAEYIVVVQHPFCCPSVCSIPIMRWPLRSTAFPTLYLLEYDSCPTDNYWTYPHSAFSHGVFHHEVHSGAELDEHALWPYHHTLLCFLSKLRLISAGVGNRGSSAVGRLIKNGKVSGAEMWCLDHDRKVLEASGTANVVVVRKEEPHMVRPCP